MRKEENKSIREQLGEISNKIPKSLGAAATDETSREEQLIKDEEELAEFYRKPDAEPVDIEIKKEEKNKEVKVRGKDKLKDIKDDIKFKYEGEVDKQIKDLNKKLKESSRAKRFLEMKSFQDKATKEQIKEMEELANKGNFDKEEIKKAKEIREREIERLKQIKQKKDDVKAATEKNKHGKIEKKDLSKTAKEPGELKKIYDELDLSGKELVSLRKKAEKAKNDEEKNELQNKINSKNKILFLRKKFHIRTLATD